MLLHALNEITASNKLIHTAIVEKNDELSGIRKAMESMKATLSHSSYTNKSYRGGDIVQFAGNNKTYQVLKI